MRFFFNLNFRGTLKEAAENTKTNSHRTSIFEFLKTDAAVKPPGKDPEQEIPIENLEKKTDLIVSRPQILNYICNQKTIVHKICLNLTEGTT